MLRAVEIVAEAVGGQMRFMSNSCELRVIGQLGRKEVAGSGGGAVEIRCRDNDDEGEGEGSQRASCDVGDDAVAMARRRGKSDERNEGCRWEEGGIIFFLSFFFFFLIFLIRFRVSDFFKLMKRKGG